MAVTSPVWHQQLPRENFPSGEKLKWILSVRRHSGRSVWGRDPFYSPHVGNAVLTLFSGWPYSPSVSDVLFIRSVCMHSRARSNRLRSFRFCWGVREFMKYCALGSGVKRCSISVDINTLDTELDHVCPCKNIYTTVYTDCAWNWTLAICWQQLREGDDGGDQNSNDHITCAYRVTETNCV